MEESEAQRMLRQQREWQQAKRSARSEGERPAKQTGKRLIVWIGLGAACLVGYGIWRGNDPTPSGPAQSVAGAIFGLARNAADDCRTLAAQPIEAGQNKFGDPNGVSFPAMLGPSAVGACSAAVEDNPNDAESWRRLGRAYIASASFAGFNEEESSEKAKTALSKAAELGDIPAAVLVTIMSFDGSQNKSEVLHNAQALAEKTSSKASDDPKDLFYYAVLKTAIMELEAFYDARRKTDDPYLMGGFRDDYKREHTGEAAALFAQALQQSGGLPFFKESWDLELLGVCGSYEYICKLADDTGRRTNDPRLFLAISASYLQEAYRIMELKYTLAGNSEQAILNAQNAGSSLASMANSYTTLAEEHGGGRYTASIERLQLAHRNFRDYALDRYDEADAAASRARSEAWTALAAVVVASALTSNGTASSADQEQSVDEYLEQMESRRCETAGDAAGYADGIAAGAIAKYAAGC